jgi:hypothetical protein
VKGLQPPATLKSERATRISPTVRAVADHVENLAGLVCDQFIAISSELQSEVTRHSGRIDVCHIEQRRRNRMAIFGVAAGSKPVEDNSCRTTMQKKLLGRGHSWGLHIPVLRRWQGKPSQQTKGHVLWRHLSSIPEHRGCRGTNRKVRAIGQFLDQLWSDQRRVETIDRLQHGPSPMDFVAALRAGARQEDTELLDSSTLGLTVKAAEQPVCASCRIIVVTKLKPVDHLRDRGRRLDRRRRFGLGLASKDVPSTKLGNDALRHACRVLDGEGLVGWVYVGVEPN